MLDASETKKIENDDDVFPLKMDIFEGYIDKARLSSTPVVLHHVDQQYIPYLWTQSWITF